MDRCRSWRLREFRSRRAPRWGRRTRRVTLLALSGRYETVCGVAGYSGTPLARKLGIAAGHTVLLDGAPSDFAVEGLPHGVTVHRRAGSGPYDVILCFCPDAATLHRRWPALHQRTTPAGSL